MRTYITHTPPPRPWLTRPPRSHHDRMARQRQRLRLGGLALALALLLLLLVQNARGFSFVPASNPTARTRGGSAVVVMRAAGEPEQPVRPRTRRELASFDRRGAVRAGSALALGLAVLGSTGGISSSSIGVSNGSSSSAARAAVPSPLVAEPRPVDSHALEVADSTSTLLAAASEAEGADASSASSSRFMDFVSGLAGGAASRASKELLLHPLDTIRVCGRMYMWGSTFIHGPSFHSTDRGHRWKN